MSVLLNTPATPTGLRRTTAILSKASDATHMLWAQTGHTTSGGFGTYFYWGDNPVTLYNDYVWIGQNADGRIQWEVNGTVFTQLLTRHASGRHHICYRRTGSLQEFFVDGYLVASATNDIAADAGFTQPTHTYLGTDTFTADTIASELWGYREWTAALSLAEIRAEMAASGPARYDPTTGDENPTSDGLELRPTALDPLTAVRTTDLAVDTPLFDRLDDVGPLAGAGTTDWVALGSFGFGTAPALPDLTDARHPGFAIRSVGAVVTGTGVTLSITPPGSIVDGDLLYLVLTHRTAAGILPNVGVPAGFERVGAEQEGAVVGETFWKRASSESGSYLVSSLDTAAAGFVVAYQGLSPNLRPVHVASARAEASGTRLGTDGLTPTLPLGLLLVSTHIGTDSDSSSVGNDAGDQGQSPNAVLFDHDLQRLFRRQINGTASGGGVNAGLFDAIKIIPNQNTNEFDAFTSGSPGGVMIAAIFEPATVATHSGTKYYFGHRARHQRPEQGQLKGGWRSTHDQPIGWATEARTVMLEQTKGALGTANDLDMFVNQDLNYDVLLWRGMSPPLLAQTIAGTVDLMSLQGKWWDDFVLGIRDDSTVSTKLHIYISKGQTTQVRSTLLRANVEAADWFFNSGSGGRGENLAAPVALTSRTCEDGDSIVVEWGYRILASPNPIPTYPPEEWTGIVIEGVGGAGAGTAGSGSPTTHSPVPLLDQVDLSATIGLAFLTFSQVLIEKHLNGVLEYPVEDPVAVVPTNQTPATAIEIDPTSDLPYASDEIFSDLATSKTRELWWKFRPNFSSTVDVEDGRDNGRNRMQFSTYNTNHSVDVQVYWDNTEDIPAGVFGTVPNRLSFELVLTGTGGAGLHRSKEAKWYDVTEDRQYWIRVRVDPTTGGFAHSGGGSVIFNAIKERSPREGDVYLQNNHIHCFDDCGNRVNGTSAFESSSPAGLAVDYSLVPLHDIRDDDAFSAGWLPTHNRERLVVPLFSLVLHEVVDLATLNKGTSEITWYANIYGNPDSDHSSVIEFEHVQDSPTSARRGQGLGARFISGFFGDGFRHVSGSPPLPAFLNSVNDPGVDADHPRRNSNEDHDNRPAFSAPDAEVFDTDPAEHTSPHYFALDEDQRTLYHTSGGLYQAVSQIGNGSVGVETDLRAVFIKKHDLETDSDLGDIGPIKLYPGFNPGLRDLVLLPGRKGILVINGSKVDWLDFDGVKLRTFEPKYQVKGVLHSTWDLITLAVCPDGDHFWCYDSESCALFKFSIFSTAQARCIYTGGVQGNSTQIMIYKPNGMAPPCW